jgi:hypothetical protein
LETLGKLVLAWFGNPIRGMGAGVIAAIVFLVACWKWPPFVTIMKDDAILRWPILILFISACGLITYPIEFGWKRIMEKFQAKKSKSKMIARLTELTPDEKSVLGLYLQEERMTQNWNRAGGTVDLLAKDGILS